MMRLARIVINYAILLSISVHNFQQDIFYVKFVSDNKKYLYLTKFVILNI
jgi:hypothetical protein